jgi:hypothetical protein
MMKMKISGKLEKQPFYADCNIAKMETIGKYIQHTD